MRKKLFVCLLLAAALMLSLGLAAHAVGPRAALRGASCAEQRRARPRHGGRLEEITSVHIPNVRNSGQKTKKPPANR